MKGARMLIRVANNISKFPSRKHLLYFNGIMTEREMAIMLFQFFTILSYVQNVL